MFKLLFLVFAIISSVVANGEFEPNPILHTTAAIQYGINGVLDTNPVVYGVENWPKYVSLNNAQIAALQAQAEAYFASRYGITFAPGPTPKQNASNGFALEAIVVGYPYSVYSMYDSTLTFRPTDINLNINPVGVVLVEFVASAVSITGFQYGGSYGAQTIPGTGATVVQVGDDVAYGIYNFTQFDNILKHKIVTELVNFRAFVPSRGPVLLPDMAYSVESFQVCSKLWGSGSSVLAVYFPIAPFPYDIFFFNNMHFHAPSSLASIPAWTDCVTV